jgi:hypothetical protein
MNDFALLVEYKDVLFYVGIVLCLFELNAGVFSHRPHYGTVHREIGGGVVLTSWYDLD